MVQRNSKPRKYLGYILFSILLLVALLYFRFPSEALKTYVQRTADEMSPHYQVSIGNAEVAFPFGVNLLATTVVPRTSPGTRVFFTEKLFIRPELISFLMGHLKYRFECAAYNGEVTGILRFQGRDMDGPFTTTLELSDIRMADHDDLAALIGRSVKGTVGGTINYSGQPDLLINGTGEANLMFSDGSVQLLEPILGLAAVNFDSLRIKMVLDKRKISLTDVALEGPDLKGTLSGTVSLRKNFYSSRLSLRGSIEPLEGMPGGKDTSDAMKFLKRGLRRGKISFVIRGTPRDPRIRLI